MSSREDELSSPIGLVAGNGTLPLQFIKEAQLKNLAVVVIAHKGETDERIESLAQEVRWVKVGQLKKMIQFFKSCDVGQVAFAGGIKRPRLFGGVWLDSQALKLIAKLGSVKDDVLLRGIAGEFEHAGMTVIAPQRILTECVAFSGQLTTRAMNFDDWENACVGWEAAKSLGALDIGQTVVVSEKLVVAVEAIEGTDAAIRRAGDLCQGKSMVVVKLPKPQQDLRLDLPAVGVSTIELMAETGANTLVLEAGKAMLLEPEKITELANKHQIAVCTFSSMQELVDSRPET